MGGEGAQWIGMAPFVDAGHFIQNIGDGTFPHSGSASPCGRRSPPASNITYKLLYNGAVAMTGGQDAAGRARRARRCTALLRPRASRRIIVTTEDLERATAASGCRRRRGAAPRPARSRPRRRWPRSPRRHGADPRPGVRRRAAPQAQARAGPRPAERVVINERVCEGCGDCGVKSNCLSVQPVDTEFGRKTRIHQSSCNMDYSCLDGRLPVVPDGRPGRAGARPDTARSQHVTVIGRFNDDTTGSMNAWVPTDPLFIVGNGSGNGTGQRSNWPAPRKLIQAL